MPKIDVPEEHILESLTELSPEARKEALRRLLPSASYVNKAVERNGPRIESIATEHGMDWNALSDKERAEFIDDLLHE